MKQIIEQNQYAHSLEHSMIDEITRKGWIYYAEHSEKPSSITDQEATVASTVGKALPEPAIDAG